MAANPRMQAVIGLQDNFSGKMKNVSASLNKTTGSLKKTEVQAKKANKSFSKFVGTVGGLGPMRLAAALGGLYAVRKLITFGKEATAAADIQERAEARLASAMRNVAGNTEDSFRELKRYASELQQVTAAGDEATISTMAMLSTFQLNADQIKQLTPRVLDMTAALEKSSGTQQEAETVAIAMGKAMTIGVGSLSRYGVVISDSAKAAFLLADAEGKVQIISEELDKNFKGIAEGSAKSLAGQVQLLSANWGDLKEDIGESIRIMGAPLVTALNEAIVGTDELGNSVNNLALFANNTAFVMKKLSINFSLFGSKLRQTLDKITSWLSGDKSMLNIETENIKSLEEEYQNLLKQRTDLDTKIRRGDSLFASVGNTGAKSMEEMAEETGKAGKAVDDLAKKYQNYTQKIEDNNATFLKAQLDRNKSFKERLADMTAEAEMKRLEYSDEINALDVIRRQGMLSNEQEERKLELLQLVKDAAKEVGLGVSAFGGGGGGIGALPEGMTALSGRTDMERFISGFKAEQGQAITAFGTGQEQLAKERQGTIINFDFSGANIVDKDKFIVQVMNAINRQGQLAELGAQ